MRDPFSLNSFYLDGVDGQQYYYTHLERVLVKAGQRVTQGQRVATVGAYRGRNAHLHLAIKTGPVCRILTKCKPVDTRVCR
jgi:murein DD-endopeptidase MepM/ murein hydrolase activator NlpD